MAAYQRRPEEQERIYSSVIAGKRHRDVCEKGARGSSTRKLKGKQFRRVGSMPRELLVAESRSNDKAAGTLLKEHGKDLYKKHGCWWGEK